MKTKALRLILENNVVAIVLTMVLAVPLLFGSLEVAQVVKPAVYGVLGVLLLAAWLLRSDQRDVGKKLGQFIRSGPHAVLMLYVFWAAVTLFVGGGTEAGKSALLMLGVGVMLYLIVVYQFRHNTHLRTLMSGLIVLCVAAVVGAFALAASSGQITNLAGTFQDRQLLGGFLALLLPVIIGIATGSKDKGLKLAAQCAAVLMVVGLLATGARSAFIGGMVGLVLFGALSLLFVRNAKTLLQRKHELLITPAIAVVALGVFLVMSGSGGDIGSRLSTLTRLGSDPSVLDRQHLSSVAVAAGMSNPITGLGIGGYAVGQAEYNADQSAHALIHGVGPSLNENAHNLWAQTMAEMGIPGVALYAAILIGFFLVGIRALRRLPTGLRKYTLVGCLAAIGGQSVDAIANPGWVFPELSMFFWLVLGLGMAAAGVGGEAIVQNRRAGATAVMPFGMPTFLYRGLRTAAIGCVVLFGSMQVWQYAIASPAYAKCFRGYSLDVDAIEFCYLNSNLPTPDCFALNAGSVSAAGDACFKVYGIVTSHPNQYGDITNAGKRLKVRIVGRGRMKRQTKGRLPDGCKNVRYCYDPSPRDVGGVLAVTAQFKVKKSKLKLFTTFALTITP